MLQTDAIRTAPFELLPSDTFVGAEIRGLDLSKPVPEATFQAISKAFADHSVLVFRDQSLTPAQRVAFSQRFGPLQVNVRSDFNHPQHPEIYTVSNVIVDGKPIGSGDAGRYWHSDLCYVEKPTMASLLYALEVPEKDGVTLGNTLFASTWKSYDDLAEDIKPRLAGLKAVNSYNAMFDRKAAEFGVRPVLTEEAKKKLPKDAVHPVVRTHPVTGRKCIYVCEGYTTRILDIPEAESDELLEILFTQVKKDEYIYRHKWRVGDLVMWDNCGVQHLASFDYALPLRRRMERTTVEGSVPC